MASAGKVKLEEYLDALTKQGTEVPPELRDVVKQQQQGPVEKPTARVSAGAPLDAPKPKRKPLTVKNKIGRYLLKKTIGDKWANKLIKPQRASGDVQAAPKTSAIHEDVKAIKRDVAEIKEHIRANGLVQKSITKRMMDFMTGKNKAPKTMSQDKKAQILKPMIRMPGKPQSMVKVPGKPKELFNMGGMKSLLKKFTTKDEAAKANDAALKQVEEDRKRTAEQDKKEATNTDIGKQDQSAALGVKKDAAQAEAQKETNAKLDKIEGELKGNKKTLGMILTLAGTVIMGAIAWIKKWLGRGWEVIKDIAKVGKMAWEFLRSLPGKIIEGVKDLWKGIKNVAGKVKGAVKGAWNKVKNVFKKGGKAAGAEGEAAGEGAAVGAAAAGSKLGKLARVGGKALGVAGAGYDVYSGVSDLAAGKRQTEMPSGWDTLSPFKWGAYAGEKINQGTSALTGGEDLSEMISRIGEKSGTPNKMPVISKTNITPQKSDLQTGDKKAAAPAMPPVIVNAPVVQAPAQSAPKAAPAAAPMTPAMILTRNPESSIARLNSSLFDDPAGWSGMSRI